MYAVSNLLDCVVEGYNSVTGNLEFIFLSNAVSGDQFPEQMKAFPVSVIEWYTNSSSLTV